jgi:DNA polymerase V
MKKYIALVDCNNFFVSCERVFNPRYQNKPTIVLSNNDGCVIARSQEVKDLGIPMGIPVFKIKDVIKKNNIKLFSSNFKLYRDMSERVISVLESFEFIDVRRYSIDEAFIYFDNFKYIKSKCELIRKTIFRQTGIPVSVGISTSKTLAKLANKIAKDSNKGIFEINQKNIESIFKDTSIGKVWGIGRGLSEKLNSFNIKTIYDYVHKENSFINKNFGVLGERIKMDLLGFDSVSDFNEPFSKSIMSSSSFGVKTSNTEEITSSVLEHLGSVLRQIRKEKRVAGFISIFIMTNRFSSGPKHNLSKSIYLDNPSSDIFSLSKVVTKMLYEIFIDDVEYVKSGVLISDLRFKKSVPSKNLFNQNIFENDNLNKAIDYIKDRFGDKKIGFAINLNRNKLISKKEMLSSEYTTNKNERLEIF